MSSGEDERVKAWRRGCREKALPPVLLMWISGLARYVILDGHDRLLAALAEGEMPPVLSLLRLQESQNERDSGEARSVADEVSAQLLAAKDPDLRPRRPFRVETANSLLIEAYDDRPSLSPVTRAWPLHGGARVWVTEVRQALEGRGASADDVREGLLTGVDAGS